MLHLKKISLSRLFFLLLSFFAMTKVYTSQIEFISKFIYGLGLLTFAFFIIHSCLQKKFTHITSRRCLFIFLFVSISIFSLTYQSSYVRFFSADLLYSNGVLFFFIYIAFSHFLGLSNQINSYILLLSLVLVPILILAGSTYTAEIFATFIFLLSVTIAVRSLFQIRLINNSIEKET